jgi:predicted HicB family RNase H-like nuclease
MAIAQLPKRKLAPNKEEEAAAAKFIEGAAAASQPTAKRTPTMIRFDAGLLARVDMAAKRRGVSRSAWVAFTLSKALDEEQGGP